MNDSLKIFLISSVKTAFLSGVIGGIAYLFGGNFAKWYLLGFVGQYVGFYLFNTFLEYKAARDIRILRLKEAEIVAQNQIQVDCAACKKENQVIVRFNQENRFICGHCNTKNSVYLNAETAVVTEPKYESEPIVNTSSTNGL